MTGTVTGAVIGSDQSRRERVAHRPELIALDPLEMWAGAECTINRVGDRLRDQFDLTGLYRRADDAERIADLGVSAVRWPILWERHDTDETAWMHTDRAMETFRRRGIRVIAGLLHHGSGPRHTHLLSDHFASGLERFAYRVAERYPWVHDYTPVNEPLTTARFSALYGIWYPHQRSNDAFVRALVNQVLSTQRAMRAVQRVSPDARLIATEDLGFTHTTAPLREQGTFENERRWLTWDLLTGAVDREHCMYTWLCRSAPVQRALQEIADAALDPRLRPAILGVNHYITSERFLDDDVTRYPERFHGGNGVGCYADVEAVRVLRRGTLGLEALLEQAFERYRLPMAVTEVHLSCTREQQMLWLDEAWTTAHRLRDRGHDVRSITAWALFGAFDWRSLLVKQEMDYECGAFDLRAPAPRSTALVPMIKALATVGSYEHPVLKGNAWWHGPQRLLYPPRDCVTERPIAAGTNAAAGPHGRGVAKRPLLITGGNGTLGHALQRMANERGIDAVALSRRALDITDAESIDRGLEAIQPWAVINAAGWVQVDAAERMHEACMQLNAEAAAALATACRARGIAFVTFSSDLVFGGEATSPFVESDRVSPRNCYGRSKVAAEDAVTRIDAAALVIRTSAFFGDWDDANFVSRILASVAAGRNVEVPDDCEVSPTYLSDLAHAVYDLLIDGAQGIWHLANVGSCSWMELAQRATRHAGLDGSRIRSCTSAAFGWHAPRPRYSVLGSERGTLLSDLDDALARYCRSRAWERIALTERAQPRHALPAAHLPAQGQMTSSGIFG